MRNEKLQTVQLQSIKKSTNYGSRNRLSFYFLRWAHNQERADKDSSLVQKLNRKLII